MPMENLQSLLTKIVENGVPLDVYNYFYLALVALVFSALGAFFGAYFKKRGEQKALMNSFEDVKERLKETTQLTEEIKASIGISTIEHQIRYTKLHEKRIEVIEKLYHLIVAMEQAARAFIHSTGPTQLPITEFEAAQKAIFEFVDYSRMNKFWVDKELFDKIEYFAHRVDRVVHKSIFHCNVTPQNHEKFVEAMDNNKLALEEITNEIPKAKDDIVNSIRKILDPNEQ